MYLPFLLFLAGSVASPDGMRIYSTTPDKNVLTVTDPKAAKFVRNIPVGPSPTGLAISPDGRRVFLCIGGRSEIDVIDTASLTKVKSIPVGPAPKNIYVTPDGTRMIALSGKKLSIINVRTESLESEISLGGTPEALIIESGKDLVIRQMIVNESDPAQNELVDYAARRVTGKGEIEGRDLNAGKNAR